MFISNDFLDFSRSARIAFESTPYAIKMYLYPLLDGNGNAPVLSEYIFAVSSTRTMISLDFCCIIGEVSSEFSNSS